MEDELKRKHHEKKKLKKDVKALNIELKSCLNILIYSTLLHKINIVVTSKSNAFLIYVNKKTNEV